MSSMFPMFVKLEGRPVLVVGAGKVGEVKINGLLNSGARIRVVAVRSTDAVRKWARRGEIDLDERDRKSTRLNSSHVAISYAVFSLKKKTSAPVAPAFCNS